MLEFAVVLVVRLHTTQYVSAQLQQLLVAAAAAATTADIDNPDAV
jgi:hypothetical protein